MKREISDETIDYIGILSKIELSHEEREQAKADIGEMLQYFDKLAEVHTEDANPMSHLFDVNNFFREDVVTNGDNRAELLRNASVQQEGMFEVPKTI